MKKTLIVILLFVNISFGISYLDIQPMVRVTDFGPFSSTSLCNYYSFQNYSGFTGQFQLSPYTFGSYYQIRPMFAVSPVTLGCFALSHLADGNTYLTGNVADGWYMFACAGLGDADFTPQEHPVIFDVTISDGVFVGNAVVGVYFRINGVSGPETTELGSITLHFGSEGGYVDDPDDPDEPTSQPTTNPATYAKINPKDWLQDMKPAGEPDKNWSFKMLDPSEADWQNVGSTSFLNSSTRELHFKVSENNAYLQSVSGQGGELTSAFGLLRAAFKTICSVFIGYVFIKNVCNRIANY